MPRSIAEKGYFDLEKDDHVDGNLDASLQELVMGVSHRVRKE